MKILSIEKWRAQKYPLTASVLVIIGTLQFVTASWITFALTMLLYSRLGTLGTVIGLLAGTGLGLTSSIMSCVLARIIRDLHAIRWNTDGYSFHGGVDLATLNTSINRLNANLERLAGVEAEEAPARVEVIPPAPPDDVEAPPEIPPESTEPPEDVPERFQVSGSMKKLLIVLAGLLSVSVIALIVAIVGQLIK